MNDQHSAKIDEILLSLGKRELQSRIEFMADAKNAEFIRRMKTDRDFCDMIRGCAEHAISESVARILANNGRKT